MSNLRLMLILLVSGCASAQGSLEGYCAGSKFAITDHAGALAQDGGDYSVLTGQLVIMQWDAACEGR